MGLNHPSDVKRFKSCFVSVNPLRERVADIPAREWILDSGAFTTVMKYGGYPDGVERYAGDIRRWQRCGRLLAAVTEDYMCEPAALARTGLSIREHQRLTIKRYDALFKLVSGVYLLPVLQGWTPADYVRHLRAYGPRLQLGAWVGVGSVCKRNSSPAEVLEIFRAIKRVRPDLRLHGFGLKFTSLSVVEIRECLFSADSMAWVYSAWKQGRNHNDWREARRFARRIESLCTPAKSRRAIY